jgi:putative hemolysin
MMLLAKVGSPAVWLLKASTDAVLRLLRLHGARDATISEEEVKSLIAEGVRAGTFVPQEREMIEAVLRLADRAVRVIMTPRSEIVWLDEQDTSRELAEKLATGARFSRYPVCRGSVDHVIGIVRTADLLEEALRQPSFRIATRMGPPLVVPDGAPVLRVLERFREEAIHLAVVVDEFGVTEGIVTLTDVLEAIVGDFPEPGEEVEPALVRRDDGSWLVDGSMPVDEFEDRTGLRSLRGAPDFHTMAGLVLHHLGHLPTVGEHVQLRGVRLEVVDMDGRRIDRLLVQPVPEPGDGEQAAPA